MTDDPTAPLQIRVRLCRGNFHGWISAGPHLPRLLCQCGRVEWQKHEGHLERIGPPIHVNGVEVGQTDLGGFVESHVDGNEFWDFDADYDAENGWSLTMLGGPESIATGRGETLAEAVAALEESEVGE